MIKGYKLLVQWKDDTMKIWACLKNLKESHTLKFVNHAITNKIQDKPVVAWCRCLEGMFNGTN